MTTACSVGMNHIIDTVIDKRVQGAVGWEAFSVGGREMLAVANIRDDETGELTSPN
jgi:hypothetical protein